MMRVLRGNGAAAVVAIIAAAGCAQVIDVDQDYHAANTGTGAAGATNAGGDGGAGGSGGTGPCGDQGETGVLGKLGAPCPEVGLLGCQQNASVAQVVCGTDLKWAPNGTCDAGSLCDSAKGTTQGTCRPTVAACSGKCGGDVVCEGPDPVRCGPDLVTAEGVGACVDQACVDGECVGDCAPGEARCSGNLLETCDEAGSWPPGAPCEDTTCLDGKCEGVCAPGQNSCLDNAPLSCGPTGDWLFGLPCVDQTCVQGTCDGICAPGQKQCAGSVPQSCGPNGMWQDEPACEGATPACVEGICMGPQCAGLPSTCGLAGNENCCANNVVAGGTFDRSNDPNTPATVNSFRLDKYEVTVGRFRAFLAAYPGSKPSSGAGAHPLIMNSGWSSAWDAALPSTQAELKDAVDCTLSNRTWTNTVGANEEKPLNCITWYEAFAFCAWDGGRLPTEAEWNYAAAGGSEQRTWTWGEMALSTQLAVYDCTGDGSVPQDCASTDILKVGSKPDGNGKWGQADLTGNLREATLDSFASYLVPCVNCANTQVDTDFVSRGGGWKNQSAGLTTAYRNLDTRTSRYDDAGARCARAQ